MPGKGFLPESHAIIAFLADGSRLIPTDPFERARMWQWMCFEQYNLEPNIATLRFWMKLGKTRAELGEKLVEKKKNGYAALDVLEETLRDREYLVAGHYSLADIALYAYTHVAHEGGFDLAPYPTIRAWCERVERQPDWAPITRESERRLYAGLRSAALSRRSCGALPGRRARALLPAADKSGRCARFDDGLRDEVEHLAGGAHERGARRDVMEQRRARQEQRAALAQLERRHRRHGSGSVAVRHHQAARPQAIERADERVLADRVVDDVDAAILRRCFRLPDPIFA